VPSSAEGGLLGGLVKWVGDRAGAQSLSELGRNMDAEFHRIKESNPAIKALDEVPSNAVRGAVAAARQLGVNRGTLNRKMKAWDGGGVRPGSR
jgi:hypothetical protein